MKLKVNEKRENLIAIGKALTKRGGKLSVNFTNDTNNMRYTELSAYKKYHYQSGRNYTVITAMVYFKEINKYRVISIDMGTTTHIINKIKEKLEL